MAVYKKTRAEALRATTATTQEAALAALSGIDLVYYNEALAGENKYISMLGHHPTVRLGTPLYNALAFYAADFMELQESIKGLLVEKPDPNQNQGGSGPNVVPGANGSMHVGISAPAAPAKPSLPGGLKKGLPGGFGASPDDAPDLNGDPNSINVSVPGAKAPPLQATTIEEVGDIMDRFEQRYGSPKGAFACDLVQLSVSKRLPDVLEMLLDRHWLNENTLAYRRVPVPGKVYANAHEQPREYYHVAHHIVHSRMTPAIMKLVGHAKMQDILPKMYVDDVAFLLQFAFDTRNPDMMRELVSDRLGIPINKVAHSSSDSAGAPILVDCAYRATAEDAPCLDILIDRGVDINSYDQYSSTPVISAARAGNGEYLTYLLNYRGVDLTMNTFNNEKLADVLANSPALRVSQQREFDARVERLKEMHESNMASWRVASAQAESKGQKPPPEPKPPKTGNRPSEFPIHYLLLAQEAVDSMGDNIELTRRVNSSPVDNKNPTASDEFDLGAELGF